MSRSKHAVYAVLFFVFMCMSNHRVWHLNGGTNWWVPCFCAICFGIHLQGALPDKDDES